MVPEGAISMLFTILLVLVLTGACVALAWPALKTADDPAEPGTVPEPGPESLEGVLVVQLAAGEITRAQYQHALAGLAARDEERHPLAVPPEPGPAT